MKSIILNCLALPLRPLPWFPNTTMEHRIDTVAHTCPNPNFYANIFIDNILVSPNQIHMTEAEQWINPRATQTEGYCNERTPWPRYDLIPGVELRRAPLGPSTSDRRFPRYRFANTKA